MNEPEATPAAEEPIPQPTEGAGEGLSLSAEALPEILTIEQAAVYLQVNPQVLYRYVRKGQVPFGRIGGLIRLKKSVLNRWIEEQSWKSVGYTGEEALQRLTEPPVEVVPEPVPLHSRTAKSVVPGLEATRPARRHRFFLEEY